MTETLRINSLFEPVRIIASDIKIAHSVFALPFALLAAFMAARPYNQNIDWSRFGGQLILIIIAMVAARTVAMLANRLIDRDIDKDNPRTAGRALPSGRLSLSAAVSALSASAIVFYAVCLAFGVLYDNLWPAWLGVPVLIWISSYAWLKRFTSLCHLYLGSSLAISPPAAALAVCPEALMTQPAIWVIAGAVLCWVAGFDIIYALQDVRVDRAQGLHSMPARLGEQRGLWISRALHVLSAACLATAGLIDPRFDVVYGLAVTAIVLLLVYEHITIARWGLARLSLAFFTLNGIISCLLGLFGIIDITII